MSIDASKTYIVVKAPSFAPELEGAEVKPCRDKDGNMTHSVKDPERVQFTLPAGRPGALFFGPEDVREK